MITSAWENIFIALYILPMADLLVAITTRCIF